MTGHDTDPFEEEYGQEQVSQSAGFSRYIRFAINSRRALGIGALAGLLIGITVVQIVPFKYEVTAILRPPDTASTGLAGALSGLSGVSALAGMTNLFSSADQSDFDAFSALLDSDDLCERMVKTHPEILPEIFDFYWDPDAKRWDHTGPIAFITDVLGTAIGMQPWQPPNYQDLEEYLEKKVDIESDFKTGMVTMTYKYSDPQFARNLIRIMYTEADNLVREQARRRSQKRIQYLTTVLPKVSQTDVHDVLIQLLASEEQNEMMVQADEYYTAWPVNVPTVASVPAWPNIPLFLGAFTALGLAVSYLLAWYKIDLRPAWEWLKSLWPRRKIAKQAPSI